MLNIPNLNLACSKIDHNFHSLILNMSWIKDSLSSSLGRKLIMSLTGLFLILFLIGHVSGNTLLFKSDGGLAFNEYAKFMTSNPAVKILSYVTYFSVLIHVIYSIILTLANQKARPVSYKVGGKDPDSIWTSRNMGILGTLILIFLVIHLRGFWYEMHWGEIGNDSAGNRDLFGVVQSAYSQLWYVALYVISMTVLAFHLSHGFSSAFQTLGLNHKKYTPIIKFLGNAFSIVVPLIFAAIPIYMYIKSLG